MQEPICDNLNSFEHEYLVALSSRLRVLSKQTKITLRKN